MIFIVNACRNSIGSAVNNNINDDFKNKKSSCQCLDPNDKIVNVFTIKQRQLLQNIFKALNLVFPFSITLIRIMQYLK